MDHLRAAFTLDEPQRERLNREGRNYWWAHIAEIADRLGLPAAAVPKAELLRHLRDVSLLFLERGDAAPLAASLEAWVQAGGVMIACSTDGLDGLLGNELPDHRPQPECLCQSWFCSRKGITEGSKPLKS